MTGLQLYTQISTLPADLKNEVSDFVEFLKQKRKGRRKIKERKPGTAKGLIKMSPDFDESLEGVYFKVCQGSPFPSTGGLN
jgi:hypothetical protein